jgi:hypothetical protein
VWALVEISVRRSLLSLLASYWLTMLGVLCLLLIAGGVLFRESGVMHVGVKALLVVATISLARFVMRAVLNGRASIWRRTTLAIGLVFVALAALGGWTAYQWLRSQAVELNHRLMAPPAPSHAVVSPDSTRTH